LALQPENGVGKLIYTACFFLHFSVVFLMSSRHFVVAVTNANTLLPVSWSPALSFVDRIAATALGELGSTANPVAQAIAAYTYCAGIETGYGFFAPRPSTVRKLVFEIEYSDGRVQYELPHVGDAATGLRLSLLFDSLVRIPYPDLRKTMLKMMAFSVWREHRDATTIRAVFGLVQLPTITEFKRGKKESYSVLYAYDFTFAPSGATNP